jgi:predicted NBD/HSP70 family sugar kinase
MELPPSRSYEKQLLYVIPDHMLRLMDMSTDSGKVDEVGATTPNTATILRQRNSRLVLDTIRGADSAVRVAKIAKLTGLSRPTVETVCDGLLAQGWLHLGASSQDSTPAVGRPARLLEFNARAGFVLAVDVGAHTISAAIADLRGETVAVQRSRVDSTLSGRERIIVIDDAINTVIDSSGTDVDSVYAATIGTPGTVSPTNARVDISPGMPGWSEVDIREALSRSLTCPIEVENDANLAAIGERARGVAAGCTDVIFLLLGERLGAGIISNDVLLRGRDGAAGELGYVKLRGLETGDPRYGPLEYHVNASALVRLGAQARDRGEDLGASDLTAEGITRSASHGHSAAIAVVQTLASTLSEGIAPALLTLNPQVLVLGGGLSRGGDVLTDALVDSLANLLLYLPQVRTSALGDSAVLQGAVTQSLARVEREVLWKVSA